MNFVAAEFGIYQVFTPLPCARAIFTFEKFDKRWRL
jgi:hypothetical protein